MVILVELHRGDLYTSAEAEMESLGQWKGAEDDFRRQEQFLLAVQRAARSPHASGSQASLPARCRNTDGTTADASDRPTP